MRMYRRRRIWRIGSPATPLPVITLVSKVMVSRRKTMARQAMVKVHKLAMISKATALLINHTAHRIRDMGHHKATARPIRDLAYRQPTVRRIRDMDHHKAMALQIRDLARR